MSPPIKSISDQKALINALKNDILTVVGTDHCAFNLKQKEMGIDDFRKIVNFKIYIAQWR
jgi:dihydropyrimidinase